MYQIQAYCHTNLDGFDCSEIKGFSCPPQIGDMVAVKYKGNVAHLKVCGITHFYTESRGAYIGVELTGKPRN